MLYVLYTYVLHGHTHTHTYRCKTAAAAANRLSSSMQTPTKIVSRPKKKKIIHGRRL